MLTITDFAIFMSVRICVCVCVCAMSIFLLSSFVYNWKKEVIERIRILHAFGIATDYETILNLIQTIQI